MNKQQAKEKARAIFSELYKLFPTRDMEFIQNHNQIEISFITPWVTELNAIKRDILKKEEYSELRDTQEYLPEPQEYYYTIIIPHDPEQCE